MRERHERIRVLRVIARLNMGGPALHVSYLAHGLAPLGYDTTLVAGELARGEDTMDFVARDLDVEVIQVPQLHREISPIYDTVSIKRLAAEIRRVQPHILHTHTAKRERSGVLPPCSPGRRSRR